MALSQLGRATQALGDHAEAVRLLNESVALLRELGEHWSMLHALIGLGAATLAVGVYTESRAAYNGALTMAHERHALPEVLEALVGLAGWLIEQKLSPERQQTVLMSVVMSIVFILDHPAATRKTIDEARRLRSELEHLLDAGQIEAAHGKAKHLTLEAAVNNILVHTATIAEGPR